MAIVNLAFFRCLIIRKLVVGREYELIETKPADGYATAESVSFKIENTGDDRNPLIWLLLFGMGGCMAGAAWYLRKKDEKDQNQD